MHPETITNNLRPIQQGCCITQHIMAINVLAQQSTVADIKTFACFSDLQVAYELVLIGYSKHASVAVLS